MNFKGWNSIGKRFEQFLHGTALYPSTLNAKSARSSQLPRSFQQDYIHLNRHEGGQSLVELALVLPVVLVLVLGVMDFGRAFYINVVLENAAREGAYFMLYDTNKNKTNATGAVQTEAVNSGVAIASGDVTIYCTPNNTCPSGSTVVVEARHTMPMIFDFLFGGPLVLRGDARMLMP